MTQVDSQTVPALARNGPGRISWPRWLALWGAVLVCEVVLLAFDAAADTYVFRATRWAAGDVSSQPYRWANYQKEHAHDADRPFFMRATPPLGSRLYARTDRLWSVFKAFGEAWMGGILVCVIGIYDRRRWAAALGAVGAAALAGGLGSLIAAVVGRIRPVKGDGANVWDLWRGFENGGDLSFPSGHATLAFSMAAVLTYLSPRGRVVFVAVAAGCAASRVVMQAHFWGDVIFGAALGWTVGWMVIRAGDGIWEKLQKR